MIKQLVGLLILAVLSIGLLMLFKERSDTDNYKASSEALEQRRVCLEGRNNIRLEFADDVDKLEEELALYEEHISLFCCTKFFDGHVSTCIDSEILITADPEACENHLARIEYGDTNLEKCEFPGSACIWEASAGKCVHCDKQSKCKEMCEEGGGAACDYVENGDDVANQRNGCKEGEEPLPGEIGCEEEGTKCDRLIGETPPCEPCVYDDMGNCLHWKEANTINAMKEQNAGMSQCLKERQEDERRKKQRQNSNRSATPSEKARLAREIENYSFSDDELKNKYPECYEQT